MQFIFCVFVSIGGDIKSQNACCELRRQHLNELSAMSESLHSFKYSGSMLRNDLSSAAEIGEYPSIGASLRDRCTLGDDLCQIIQYRRLH